MPPVIIAMVLGLIALMSGKKKTDEEPTPDGQAEPSSVGSGDPNGKLVAVGNPTVAVFVDGKAQTGKTVVIRPDTDHIRLSVVWSVSNAMSSDRIAGLKIKWVHQRGGQPDDTWAEWLPYFDSETGLSGLIEDELMKDTGTPMLVGHGVDGKMVASATMVKIPPASVRPIKVELVIPGPGRSDKLAKFWKDHNGANFRLVPELVSNFQPDQGPSGTQKFLAGGLLLGNFMGPLLFGGATEIAGSAGQAPIYSLKKTTLSSFMSISHQAKLALRGSSIVEVTEPSLDTYEAYAPIPYSASVKIVNPDTFPKTTPLVEWIFRAKTDTGTSGWGKLDGESGVARWPKLGEYELQASVPDNIEHNYAGDHKVLKFKVVKAKPLVVLDLPHYGPWFAGDTVEYKAHVEVQGTKTGLPVVWKYKKEGGEYQSLGSNGRIKLLETGSYDFRAEVAESSVNEFSDAARIITVAAKAGVVNKFIVGDHVTDGFANGFVESLEDGGDKWWYHFQDQFGFTRRVLGEFLSLYVAPVVAPTPVSPPPDLGPYGVDDGTGQDDLPAQPAPVFLPPEPSPVLDAEPDLSDPVDISLIIAADDFALLIPPPSTTPEPTPEPTFEETRAAILELNEQYAPAPWYEDLAGADMLTDSQIALLEGRDDPTLPTPEPIEWADDG